MREAEEVERFGLPLSKFFTLLGRVATEADQPGFRRVQCQFELPHSFLQLAGNDVRSTHADNCTLMLFDPCPPRSNSIAFLCPPFRFGKGVPCSHFWAGFAAKENSVQNGRGGRRL
jgi:hypothetical protein